MSERPLFSIVIPVYNRAKTIGPTLQSVHDQTFEDYECLVVDDGSRDGAQLRAVIEELNDPRFIYLHRENGGGGAARNTGIDAARGKYIAFLDSDDLFLPKKLDVFAQIVASDSPTALYSQALVDRGTHKYWIRPDRALGLNEDIGEYLFVHNQFISTITMVIKTEYAKSIRFDPNLQKFQDLDFCIRLHAAGVRFKMIAEPLAIWKDISEDNRTSRTKGYAAPMAWLMKVQHLLTPKAVHGFRATCLAYFLADERPFLALRYLFIGWQKGGVSLKVTLRQTARCFFPRNAYRWLVGVYVGAFGTRQNNCNYGQGKNEV
jgi:glycosyltransferase involved in cell wall biosynthesis